MGAGGQKPCPDSAYRTDFLWSTESEPHASRRKAILKAHPEINKLQGPDWRNKYVMLGLTAAQAWLSVATRDLSWPAYLFVAYVFGATLGQALFLATHELAHNLACKSPWHNRLLSFVVNFPQIFPYVISFRNYHLEHHKFQGEDGIDVDVPSEFEGRYVRGPFRKVLWASCQILAYVFRPMFVNPKDVTRMQALNIATQLAYDAVLVYFFGLWPLFWGTLSIFLAGGLHPCAGHFISEHYVFPHLDATQETYSYYGPLNWLTFNVGYHNEHHDFPYVAGSRLPQLNKVAHEFYDDLAVCDSWTGVIYDYIMRPEIGPFSRVKRRTVDQKTD